MAQTACPHCWKRMQVPDAYLGREVKCDGCGASFVAEQAVAASPPPPRTATPAVPAPALASTSDGLTALAMLLKWISLGVAMLIFAACFNADTAIQQAALAGMACFWGIIARIMQAEQFR